MIRPLALTLVVSCAFVGAVEAQNTRADLLRQATTAYDDFAPARALEFARAALDPGIGVPDSTWVRTVHLMTHVLLETGDATLAGLWARWAMRTWPAFEIDSVGFVPAVVAQLRSARASVVSRTAGDDVTRMAYQWPARGSTQNTGQLRLGPSALQVPLNVVVRDARGTRVGVLAAGPGLALGPGTYDIEVGASGFLPIRIQREVLPGVALTFSFDLTSAAIVSGTIGEPARQRAYRSTAALAVTRFGTSAPFCAGGAVAGGRLLLTTYAAIRGASALAATIGGAAVAGEVRVAAYDISRNLAVLALPAARTDSLLIAPLIVDGQAAWGIGLTQCRTPGDTRVTIDEWSNRPVGALTLGAAVAQSAQGAPVVDYLGRLAGLWAGSGLAVAAPQAVDVIGLARRNLDAQTVLTATEVARRENHLYGALTVTADVSGATVRLTPLEAWHWAELARSGSSPFEFTGPVGRYRLETSAPGLTARTQDVVIRPGEVVRVQVPLRVVTQGQPTGPQPAVKKGGVPRWVWLAVLGAGGAAAAALGGGGGGDGGGGGGGPSTGTITIQIPVNPP